MDKKYIYWGLGLVAVGGLAYYFMSGMSSGAKSLDSGASNEPLTDGANSSATTASTSLDETLGALFTTAGSSKKQIVRVLLDNSSDGGLVFVNKGKPMLLPYSKRLGSTLVEYFEWDRPN